MPMYNFPVYLSLEAANVAVVGGGKVGRRKIVSLCRARAASIQVFDPSLSREDAEELAAMPSVSLFTRKVEEADLLGKQLVFAASSDREENARVAAICASANILCNVADTPELGTFILPALTETNGLSAAFSTGGQSPALARRIRKESRFWLEENYGPLLIFMGRLRPLVLGCGLDSEKNAALFRKFVYSRLGDLLVARDRAAAGNLVAMLLPESLHGHIEELLDGLC